MTGSRSRRLRRLVRRSVAALAPGLVALAAVAPATCEPLAGDPQRLGPGSTITREIGGAEHHRYAIALTEGDFAELEIRQHGVDVEVRTFDVDGAHRVDFDSAGGSASREPAYVLARTGGDHLVEVHPFDAGERGTYELAVVEVRRARADDRRRMPAEAAFAAGRKLRGERTAHGRRAAIDRFHEALTVFREIGDSTREADLLTYLGGEYLALREPRQALRYYEPAVGLFDAAGELRRAALTRINIGWCHDNLARFGSALIHLERAAEQMRELELPGGEATALASMGRILETLGDDSSALEMHERSAEIWNGLGATNGQAIAQRNRGRLMQKSGLHAEALQAFEQALRSFQATGNRRRQAQCLIALARSRHELGEHDPALQLVEDAGSMSRAAGDRVGESEALRLAGRIHRARGARAQADAALTEALGQARAVEDRAGEAETLYLLALLARDRGQSAQAVARVEAAVGVLETIRDGLGRDDLRRHLTASRQPYYDLWIELLLERELEAPSHAERARAFHVAERGRARTLLEQVNLARIEPRREPPGPGSLASAQALIDETTALVAYELGAERALAFLVTSDALRVARLDARSDRVRSRAENLAEILSTGNDGWQAVARRLGDELVVPWLEQLPTTVRRLIVIPDDVLNFLPFEALIVDGHEELLIERFTVSYAPSVAVLAELRDRAATPETAQVLVLADPELPGSAGPRQETRDAADATRAFYEKEGFELGRLPFAAQEARAVNRYSGSAGAVFTGRRATESRIKNGAARQAAVLHFATHGLVSRWAPELSALVLAPDRDDADDGFLQAREIYGLDLDCELVVLSACRTAQGQLLPGEGVLGLVQAFLHAGTRSVVASLWNVRDDRTTTLMQSFYRHLSLGLDRGEALRAAKLELLSGASTAAPRFWAPFILVGDARRPLALAGTARPGPRIASRAAAVALSVVLLSGGLALAYRKRRRGRPG